MASYLPNLGRDNYSYNTIPIAWLLALAPRMYARAAYYSATKKDMDTGHPREFAKTVQSDTSCDAKVRSRITRAEAAMANGFENLTLYAAAVTAGNSAGLDARTMNYLSLAYLGVRLAYNYFYVVGETKANSICRIGCWFSGVAMCFTMFLQAGSKMRKSVL